MIRLLAFRRSTGIRALFAIDCCSEFREAEYPCLAHCASSDRVGAGDPATGEFQDAVVLARFGEVDLDSLSE